MVYVDGFVLPVPKKNLQAYRKMARQAGKFWKKHGALEFVECVGDDLKPNMGGMKLKTFPQIIRPKPNETIMFSFIIYKSRTHRDRVNAKVMKDPAMNDPDAMKKMMNVFDPKRMVYGGFKSIVDISG